MIDKIRNNYMGDMLQKRGGVTHAQHVLEAGLQLMPPSHCIYIAYDLAFYINISFNARSHLTLV